MALRGNSTRSTYEENGARGLELVAKLNALVTVLPSERRNAGVSPWRWGRARPDADRGVDLTTILQP